MNLKGYFINSDETATDKTKKETPKVKPKVQFPSENTDNASEGQSTNTFNFGNSSFAPQNNSAQVDEEHLNKALEVYQNGFDSLNQPGYDFYEFYQSVVQGGIGNPQIYKMAFTMGTAMDKTITKDKLIQQSDYYLTEINKVYDDYVSKGNDKRGQLVEQKNHENQSLLGELDLMKQQLEALKTQIQDRQNKLSSIDGKYQPKIAEIDSKLSANDMAKDKVVQSIEQVKQGIISNLK